MSRIVNKVMLNEEVIKFTVKNEAIAKNAKPGQFIILRIDEKGERVPFTISETDNEGNVSIIVQVVGFTTMRMKSLKIGDGFLDFVGPLGKPTEVEDLKNKKICIIGGGLGSAIAYPQAKFLFKENQVDVIAGFRNKELIILKEEFEQYSDNLYIMTDDGSYGQKGFVTEKLKELLENGKNYDLVIAIGPLIMMKNVSLITKQYNIETIVSMNSIMLDGTGMCGCCRLTYDGEMKFACVDGPDFDASKIDFDEAIARSRFFKQKEMQIKNLHTCNLTGDVRHGKI